MRVKGFQVSQQHVSEGLGYPRRRSGERGLLILLALLTSGLGACSGQGGRSLSQPAEQELVVVEGNDGRTAEYCTPLFAGKDINAGSVCISSDDGVDLLVKYTTIDGWELSEAHMWIGELLADMPQTRKGNPKIGSFPYKSGDITGASSFTFSVPVEVLGGEPYVCDRSFLVAAHAALRKFDADSGTYGTETGWANGQALVQKGSWGTYFPITLHCTDEPSGGGEPPSPDQACETAFGYGNAYATCFEDLDLDGDQVGDFSRWGWSNGPLGPGSYSFPIYQAAGQCDLTKGTIIGTLSVEYDGTTATVSFATSGDYVLNETHIYVGSEPLPRDVNGEFTIAPGQFPYIHALEAATSDSFTITGLSGDIYVVAHAVSCLAPKPPASELKYTLSEFIASAAEGVWPYLPSDFQDIDPRAGSVEINTNGGIPPYGWEANPAFDSFLVTLRNGTSATLEQIFGNFGWSPALDENGCNTARSWYECWLWRAEGQDVLPAFVPGHVTSSNEGFDSISPRVTISGGIRSDYTIFDGASNKHQTVEITWAVPEGRVLRHTAQMLFRLRFDRCQDGLESSDVMLPLLWINGYDRTEQIAPIVSIINETETSLTASVNVDVALRYVAAEYEKLGLTCPNP